MPLYNFQSGDIIKEFFFSMKDVPSVGSEIIDEVGVHWTRIFTVPNAAINTSSDPYSVADFNKKLDGKNVTFGDMFDASKEASEKRAAKDGVDPIKKEYYKKYSKERRGAKHSAELKENQQKIEKEALKDMKVIVDHISKS